MEQTSDMYCQTRLHKRGAVYYFRAMVPKDLIRHYGKREIVYSLRTKDHREAVSLVRKASPKLDDEFAALRQRLYPAARRTLSVIDTETIEKVCSAWRHACLDGDQHNRSSELGDDEYEAQCSQRAESLEALRAATARGRFEQIQPVLEQFLYLVGVEFVGKQEELKQLALAFLETVTETHAAQVRRDQGEVVRTPPPVARDLSEELAPQRAESVQRQGKRDATSHALLDVYEWWVKAKSDRPGKTLKSYKSLILDFSSFVKDKPADQITDTDILDYCNKLRTECGLRGKTIKNKIANLSAMFGCAVKGKKLTSNPASGLEVDCSDSEEDNRLPLSHDDLKAICDAPIYTGHERPLGGGGEASVWFPPIAVYSGLRLDEIGQLRVEDIRCESGIWFLDLTTWGGKDDPWQRRLKNKPSRRRMPIHPELKRIGFLNYVQKLKRSGSGWLFPDLAIDCEGKRTGNWSKWWGRYRRKKVGITSERKPFHSTRHTFRDACREAEHGEELADALMGHSRKGRAGRGYGLSFSLRRLHNAVCKIGYPDVQFPILCEK